MVKTGVVRDAPGNKVEVLMPNLNQNKMRQLARALPKERRRAWWCNEG